MSDLVAWLEQQIAADEAIAQHANGLGGWRLIDPDESDEATIGTDNHNMILYGEGGHTWEDAEHIVTWDPARVLAECKAKRAIIQWLRAGLHPDQQSGLEIALECMVKVYADRPGCEAAWKAYVGA